jgi:hypothetical protein
MVNSYANKAWTWLESVPILWPVLGRGKVQFGVFIFGFLLFSSFIFYFSIVPQSERQSLPAWTTMGSMIIINRAAQIEQCYVQDCPALQDLNAQSSPTKSKLSLSAKLESQRGPYFTTYNHLNSAMVWLLKKSGLSWIDSYQVVRAFSTLLIAVGIAYWLFVLFGPTAAGLALALLVGMYDSLPEPGIFFVIPGTISMGVSMLFWGIIVQKRGDVGFWLPIMVIIPMAIHPYGVGAGGITLGIFFLFRVWSHTRRDILLFVAGWSGIVAFYLISFFVTKPEFGIFTTLAKSENTESANLWSINFDSIPYVMSIIEKWAIILGINNFAILTITASVILLSLVRKNFSPSIVLSLLLGLCIVAIFSGSLAIPAINRYWVALSVFLVGVFSVFILSVISIFLYFLKKQTISLLLLLALIIGVILSIGLYEYSAITKCLPCFGLFLTITAIACLAFILETSYLLNNRSKSLEQRYILWWKMTHAQIEAGTIIVLLGLLLAGQFVHHRTIFGKYYARESPRDLVNDYAARFNYIFDFTQPPMLHNPEHPCKKVLYLSGKENYGTTILNLMYFTEGAMNCGALFYKFISDPDNTQALAFYEKHKSEITHIVFLNPVHIYKSTPISIHEADLNFKFWKDVSGKPWRFLLKNTGIERAVISLKLTSTDSMNTTEFASFSVPPKWEGWVETQLPSHASERQFTLVDSGQSVLLKGVRLGDEKNRLHWPWDQGVEISFNTYQLEHGRPKSRARLIKKFTISESELGVKIPTGKVVADRGMSALAIVPPK